MFKKKRERKLLQVGIKAQVISVWTGFIGGRIQRAVVSWWETGWEQSYTLVPDFIRSDRNSGCMNSRCFCSWYLCKNQKLLRQVEEDCATSLDRVHGCQTVGARWAWKCSQAVYGRLYNTKQVTRYEPCGSFHLFTPSLGILRDTLKVHKERGRFGKENQLGTSKIKEIIIK